MCASLQDTASDEALASTIGVLTVLSENSPQQGHSSVHLQPISTAIVLEGGIVMDNIKDLPVIWAYICFAPLPEMHGKYTQIHSNSNAWIGKQNPLTKTANSVKHCTGLDP